MSVQFNRPCLDKRRLSCEPIAAMTRIRTSFLRDVIVIGDIEALSEAPPFKGLNSSLEVSCGVAISALSMTLLVLLPCLVVVCWFFLQLYMPVFCYILLGWSQTPDVVVRFSLLLLVHCLLFVLCIILHHSHTICYGRTRFSSHVSRVSYDPGYVFGCFQYFHVSVIAMANVSVVVSSQLLLVFRFLFRDG